jgi:hypothetical protein
LPQGCPLGEKFYKFLNLVFVPYVFIKNMHIAKNLSIWVGLFEILILPYPFGTFHHPT